MLAVSTLLTTLTLLAGCASNDLSEYYDDYDIVAPQSVSARDYGYVRPAGDVVVLGQSNYTSNYRGNDVWQRIRSGQGLGIPHHPRVDRAIRSIKRNPRYTHQLYRRASPYLHLLVNEIERHGMPVELALLPEIESGYNPRALSHASAAGMWQFIPSTGRIFGLPQNGLYDGRYDVYASTSAAMRYLRKLNRRFNGDWAKALAGYNCGGDCVARAVARNRRAGKPTDFWSLNLPSETKDYVPKLMAVAAVVRNPGKYGMALQPIPNHPVLDVVELPKQTSLSRVAKVSGVNVGHLRRLNPGLKQGKTRPKGPHRVLMPISGASKVRVAMGGRSVVGAPIAVAATPTRPRQSGGRLAVRLPSGPSRSHRVGPGESLATVARAYGVDMAELALWNALAPGEPLLPGQSLRIYGGSGMEGRHLVEVRVRSGETLAQIARRYGVSVGDLKRWNSLNHASLRPGEILKLYPKRAA